MQDICRSQGIWQLLRLRRLLVAEGHSYYFSRDFRCDESMTDYICTICREVLLILIHKFDNIINIFGDILIYPSFSERFVVFPLHWPPYVCHVEKRKLVHGRAR